MTLHRNLELLLLYSILGHAPRKKDKIIIHNKEYNVNKLENRFKELIEDYLSKFM